MISVIESIKKDAGVSRALKVEEIGLIDSAYNLGYADGLKKEKPFDEPPVDRELILFDSNTPSLYRHFKGHWYSVKGVGRFSENMQKMVEYVALYNDAEKGIKVGDKFYRPYNMFLGKTDKEKHPDAEQEYRFMHITELKLQFSEDKFSEFIDDFIECMKEEE